MEAPIEKDRVAGENDARLGKNSRKEALKWREGKAGGS